MLKRLFLLLAVLVVSAAYADKTKSAEIMLFDQPSVKSQVIEKINPNQRLIPIFHQKEWTKVGNPDNGKVGWINNQQYRDTLKAWYEPDVQTVYVQSSENKAGKPQVTITAYRNGKQLSDSEARELYQTVEGNFQQQQQAIQAFNQRMDRLFEQQTRFLNEEFGFSHGFLWPSTQPVIVINQGAPSSAKQ